MRTFVLTIVVGFMLTSCTPQVDVGSEGTQYWHQRLTESERILQGDNLSTDERGDALMDTARAYSGLGEKEKAKGLWTDILQRDDVSPYCKARAQYRLASALEAESQWQEAVEGYRKYSSMYTALSERQQYRFDQNQENGDAMLYHAGELLEHRLHKIDQAEVLYRQAVENSRKNDAINHVALQEHLGDFYFRQKQFDKAIAQYEMVSASFQKNESSMASPATRPEYKIISCLMLAGRKEDARKRYERFSQKWGKTDYQLDKDYVEKARILMKENSGGRQGVQRSPANSE